MQLVNQLFGPSVAVGRYVGRSFGRSASRSDSVGWSSMQFKRWSTSLKTDMDDSCEQNTRGYFYAKIHSFVLMNDHVSLEEIRWYININLLTSAPFPWPHLFKLRRILKQRDAGLASFIDKIEEEWHI